MTPLYALQHRCIKWVKSQVSPQATHTITNQNTKWCHLKPTIMHAWAMEDGSSEKEILHVRNRVFTSCIINNENQTALKWVLIWRKDSSFEICLFLPISTSISYWTISYRVKMHLWFKKFQCCLLWLVLSSITAVVYKGNILCCMETPA